MKFTLIAIALVLLFGTVKAQNADTARKANTDTAKKWIPVDVEPVPQGGIQGFYMYLLKNLKYPKVAKEYNTQGKVRVEFVVEKDGSLTNIKVTESLTPETDAEAIRLIQKCPRWTPGMAQGKPVRVRYTVPVKFELPGN